MGFNLGFKGLNAELNPICHLLALLGAHHILHVSRIRVKNFRQLTQWEMTDGCVSVLPNCVTEHRTIET